MAKFRGIMAARPELTIHTRRPDTIVRASVRYHDGSIEVFVLDERGRFRLSAVYCGEAAQRAEKGGG